MMMNRILLKLFTIVDQIRQNVYLTTAKKRGLQVGENTTFIGFTDFGSEPYLIEIGSNSRITTGIRFITHDGGLFTVNNLKGYEDARSFARIKVGNNVFIGNNCILLPGSSIGNNCVLGAGSVLTGSMPDNCVYAGVPAKFITSIEDYADRALKNSTQYPRELEKNRKDLDNYLKNNLPHHYKPVKTADIVNK